LVDIDEFKGLNLSYSNLGLRELFAKCELVYLGNGTSAVIEGYYALLPVVCFLDPTELNMSPLRAHNKIKFASTPEELVSAVNERHFSPADINAFNDYFFLDCAYPRWKKLLGIQN
jgi:surface carbohydrate biosynthesis protein (TIGR04326 family)